MKPAYGDSGVGSSAKYKASTSGYNNHSGSGRYSSPGRKRTGGGTGSGGGKHFKKKHFKKNKNKTKDDKPQGDKKDDKGETKPISFATAFAQGVFSFLALSMIAKSGLFVTHAVAVAASPIAGRISRCYSAWCKITRDNWVLRVVREGYRLQYKAGPPPTPHRVANLPTDKEGAAILDIEVSQIC